MKNEVKINNICFCSISSKSMRYTFSNLFILTLVFLSVTILAVRDVQAGRPKVSCEFSWAENPALNVKAGNRYRNKNVRTSEYNRLIAMGTVPARVAADRGQHCQLNHPENTLIDTLIEKDIYRLNTSGRIPNCSDLNATVTCRGVE